MKNFEHQLKILKENFSKVEQYESLKEYIETAASNDPNFYRCFFGAELEQDFDTSLSDEQRLQFQEFLLTL